MNDQQFDKELASATLGMDEEIANELGIMTHDEARQILPDYREPVAFEEREYTLPKFTLSYIVNGDSSGLQDTDINAIDKFMQDEGLENGILHSFDDEPFFTTYHDLLFYDVPACNCVQVVFSVQL